MPPPSGLRSRRSLGNKRRDVPPARAADILPLLGDYAHGTTRTVSKDDEDEEVT